MKIDLYDGKYTVYASEDMRVFKALRYGEEWRDLTGDNLVYFMALRIEELEATLSQIQDDLREVDHLLDKCL